MDHRPDADAASEPLAELLALLGRPGEDVPAAWGTPTTLRERLIGAPAISSRQVRFAGGLEAILHDGRIVAFRPRSDDIAAWVPGADSADTLAALQERLPGRIRYAGRRRYVGVDGAFLSLDLGAGGPGKPGNLVGLTLIARELGESWRPEVEDCAVCADLVVRDEDGGDDGGGDGGGDGGEDGGEMDLDRTVRTMLVTVGSGALVEDLSWVPLVDLLPLRTSGLMRRIESQARCTTCERILCITLHRDQQPRFTYCTFSQARQHRLDPIPPVAAWGDEDRIAADRDALHYRDHQPGAWFLLERNGTLYLDLRYTVSTQFDDTALIALDEAETQAYADQGRAYLSALAIRIADSAPHRATSPFHDRDLLQGDEGRGWRDRTTLAVRNHSWAAQQRQRE